MDKRPGRFSRLIHVKQNTQRHNKASSIQLRATLSPNKLQCGSFSRPLLVEDSDCAVQLLQEKQYAQRRARETEAAA